MPTLHRHIDASFSLYILYFSLYILAYIILAYIFWAYPDFHQKRSVVKKISQGDWEGKGRGQEKGTLQLV